MEVSKLKLADIQRIAEHELDFQRAYQHRINVCCSSACVHLGALKVLKAFEDAIKEFGVERQCKVAKTGCVGTCSVGPVVIIDSVGATGQHLYQNVTPEKVRKIVQDHIVLGLPASEMLYKNDAFFQKQRRLILKNVGKIDAVLSDGWPSHSPQAWNAGKGGLPDRIS